MVKQIDQLNSHHNQQEVKNDLKYLIDNVASLSHLKDQPDVLYKEILANMTGVDLINTIKSEFMSQDINVLRAHPSYNLVQQAMLDFFGYHQTQIDSDL